MTPAAGGGAGARPLPKLEPSRGVAYRRGVHEPTICTDELRPTYLEVDLGRLAENYRVIAAHVAPARVMPILKANAYGHGLCEVARRASPYQV